jgi:hypothetical protein
MFSARFFKRTFHLLIEADNSHATDTSFRSARNSLRPARLVEHPVPDRIGG